MKHFSDPNRPDLRPIHDGDLNYIYSHGLCHKMDFVTLHNIPDFVKPTLRTTMNSVFSNYGTNKYVLEFLKKYNIFRKFVIY